MMEDTAIGSSTTDRYGMVGAMEAVLILFSLVFMQKNDLLALVSNPVH